MRGTRNYNDAVRGRLTAVYQINMAASQDEFLSRDTRYCLDYFWVRRTIEGGN